MQTRTADGAVRLLSVEKGAVPTAGARAADGAPAAGAQLPTSTTDTADVLCFLETQIAVTDPSLRLSPQQAENLQASHPTLAEHACRQQGIGRFGDKITSASLPHIVEHLAIDLLVAAYGQPIAGNTVWQDKEAQTMLVRLRVPQGLLAAAASAIRDAVCELEYLL